MNTGGWSTPSLEHSDRDRFLLTTARALRGFGAGALSVVLVIELSRGGYSAWQIGLILGLAMGAAATWAILMPGRLPGVSGRALLVLGALTLAAGGFLLWFDTVDLWALLPAVLLGGIVAGGADISPLGALEQGSLAGVSTSRNRTRLFVEYNFLGYVGTAVGALVAGPLIALRFAPAGFPAAPRDAVLLLYGLLGLALVPVYLSLSSGSSSPDERRTFRRLSPDHRGPILRLSELFTLDALGGGMVANALVSYFLLVRFGASPNTIGYVLSLANIAAGVSLLLALPLARRLGLINTMVFTHIPSSVLLILFAFTPTVLLAGAVWVVRATLSQMDVPTRQSYTQAIVPKEEGAAAAGYTTAARSAQAFGGPISGALFSVGGPWLSGPFALAGSVKIAYDLALFRGFRHLRPPEESSTDNPLERSALPDSPERH